MAKNTMTVTVYHSHRESMFRPFDADTSTLAVAYTMRRAADLTSQEVLDKVFYRDNVGGGYTEAASYFDPAWLTDGWLNYQYGQSGVGRNYRQQRSLSVGDVVLVSVDDEAYQTYAVAPVGFDAIDYPVDAVVRGANDGFDGMQACCLRDADLHRREEAEAARAARGLYS